MTVNGGTLLGRYVRGPFHVYIMILDGPRVEHEETREENHTLCRFYDSIKIRFPGRRGRYVVDVGLRHSGERLK